MRVSPRACVRESHFGGSAAVEAEIVGPSADDDTRKCREMAGKTLDVSLIFNATWRRVSVHGSSSVPNHSSLIKKYFSYSSPLSDKLPV